MWTEAIISLTSPSLWWTRSGPVALQEMAGPMAPGPPAMIVFCYGSCEGLATLVLYLHLPMSAVLLLWSWVSGGSQSPHLILKKDHCDLPLTHKAQYFFFFGKCPTLISIFVTLYRVLWGSVCLIAPFSHWTLSLGGNLSAAFDPTCIFISCGQCSNMGPTAGLKPGL